MNYLREFYGKKPYTEKQPMIDYGSNFLGHVFCDAWVDYYNKFTERFNKSRCRASQEFYLGQRHKFVVYCVAILENEV